MTEPVTLTDEQIQEAARSGENLLSDPNLKVSLNEANSLVVLKMVLNAVSSGKVVLRAPDLPEETKTETPKEE